VAISCCLARDRSSRRSNGEASAVEDAVFSARCARAQKHVSDEIRSLPHRSCGRRRRQLHRTCLLDWTLSSLTATASSLRMRLATSYPPLPTSARTVSRTVSWLTDVAARAANLEPDWPGVFARSVQSESGERRAETESGERRAESAGGGARVETRGAGEGSSSDPLRSALPPGVPCFAVTSRAAAAAIVGARTTGEPRGVCAARHAAGGPPRLAPLSEEDALAWRRALASGWKSLWRRDEDVAVARRTAGGRWL
jgi:hypothetical protein